LQGLQLAFLNQPLTFYAFCIMSASANTSWPHLNLPTYEYWKHNNLGDPNFCNTSSCHFATLCGTPSVHIMQFEMKKKQTPWPESASEPYRPNDHRLSAELVPTFADRGCHVVSATDPCGRNLGFLDRSRYFFFRYLFSCTRG
jgi:hypothetical protein